MKTPKIQEKIMMFFSTAISFQKTESNKICLTYIDDKSKEVYFISQFFAITIHAFRILSLTEIFKFDNPYFDANRKPIAYKKKFYYNPKLPITEIKVNEDFGFYPFYSKEGIVEMNEITTPREMGLFEYNIHSQLKKFEDLKVTPTDYTESENGLTDMLIKFAVFVLCVAYVFRKIYHATYHEK